MPDDNKRMADVALAAVGGPAEDEVAAAYLRGYDGACICASDPDRACMAACEVCLRRPDDAPCPSRSGRPDPGEDAKLSVKGRCPNCGHLSLFLGDGGRVTCSAGDCDDPDMVDDLLRFAQRYGDRVREVRLAAPAAPSSATTEGAEPAEGTYWERAVLRRFVDGGPVDLATVRTQVGVLLGEARRSHDAAVRADEDREQTEDDADGWIHDRSSATPEGADTGAVAERIDVTEHAIRGVLAERGWYSWSTPVADLVAKALDHHGARTATEFRAWQRDRPGTAPAGDERWTVSTLKDDGAWLVQGWRRAWR